MYLYRCIYLILELYSQKIRFNDFPGIFVKYLCIFRNLLMKKKLYLNFFFAFLITLIKVYQRSHLLIILECSMIYTNVS